MNANFDPGPTTALDPFPSGTVTFAFTDIEGSTQRWERNRAAMRDALRLHDAIMRAAITRRGGHVFKTIGDAFCAAFARPADALSAMLDAQRALALEDFSALDGLRVRIAIHTGTADERDGDYFGPVVNRVARLLAIGHGGQILVSGVTGGLTQSALPGGATLLDLGEHRLKDLARPEHVYQLLAPDLRDTFPPLRSLDALPNNLPRMLTSFIGRETEIAEIHALLETHRLITFVGSGGLGKTRTSLQVAANLLEGWSDGVWFIELAPLSSGEYVAETVAKVLSVNLGAEGEPLEQLVRALREKRALLVFDNCEHLVEEVARVVAALLRDCRQIKILASSRQRLGIDGETAYRMPSLAVPSATAGEPFAATDAYRYAAVTLFVERARAVDPRFVLGESAPTIAEICRRLDGIPLAIELAAARIKILSPRQLRERLDERFRMLTGGSRDALPRQQTLRALIDWSHELLDERERELFRRLSIFVNGFTLEGAVAVGRGESLDEFDILDVLGSLVDKSLVLAEPAGDALRYRLLESTRVYAREKLAAANEVAVTAESHLGFLRDLLVEAQHRAERTARRAELDDVLATELEDVRAALDAAANGPGAHLGGEILAETSGAWFNLGLDSEGLERGEAFLAALPDAEPRLLARLAIAVARLANNADHVSRGLDVATLAVAHAQASADPSTLADALLVYAKSVAALHDFGAAEAALIQAETIAGGSTAQRLRLLDGRYFLSHLRGDHATAAETLVQLREEHRSLGNAPQERVSAMNLAEAEYARGDAQRAIAIVREVLPAFRETRVRTSLATILANLAGYLVAIDDLPGASAAAREALAELEPREPASVLVAVALEHLALTLALRGNLSVAATLTGYIDVTYRTEGFGREFTEAVTHERLSSLLRAQLDPTELERIVAEGERLAPRAAIALAVFATAPAEG